MEGQSKVSVIVPIYKVEPFIGRCARTLMEQTLDDIEYIFVDDATPDNSIGVLQEVLSHYPDRQSKCKILRHEVNKGLPAARNTGLAECTGKYIFHCDSDDYIEPDMLESMYSEALAKDADIVWCDWFLSFGKNERYMGTPSCDTPEEALKTMLAGAMKYNVWNKIVRRSLYTDNSITFPAGFGMGEDMTMLKLFACARKSSYVHKAYYHYVQLNSGAFSKTYSERHLQELRHNVSDTAAYLSDKLGDVIEEYIGYFKLNAKFHFLISADKEKWALWKSWYPEANKYIPANKAISFRSRAIQWCAWKNQFWLVWLYYQLVHKIIYGVIYK